MKISRSCVFNRLDSSAYGVPRLFNYVDESGVTSEDRVCSSSGSHHLPTFHQVYWKLIELPKHLLGPAVPARMVTSPKHKLIPLIPLARDGVLLPGVTLRIPVHNRPDIPALLSSVYTRVATPKPATSTISVGCVPLCSPLLSPEGQNLLEDAEIRVRKTAEHLATNPGKAGEKDLFAYGTVAKISGIQGRRPGDLALVVEGVRRFRIERFTQFKPYMEAEVVYIDEDGR